MGSSRINWEYSLFMQRISSRIFHFILFSPSKCQSRLSTSSCFFFPKEIKAQMKFGKSLSNQIEETLPEWRDKFLSYKDLKKRLKRIQPNGSNANKRPKTSLESYSATDTVHGNGKTTMTEEETDFVSLLQLELDKFNYFFLEKEEEYVIRQKELHDRMATATIDAEEEQLMKIRKEIVDFHGEMVLLENYSALNYTGRLIIWLVNIYRTILIVNMF